MAQSAFGRRHETVSGVVSLGVFRYRPVKQLGICEQVFQQVQRFAEVYTVCDSFIDSERNIDDFFWGKAFAVRIRYRSKMLFDENCEERLGAPLGEMMV